MRTAARSSRVGTTMAGASTDMGVGVDVTEAAVSTASTRNSSITDRRCR